MERDAYYSVAALKKMSKRVWAIRYDKPFEFNITVNDMRDVQSHKPTKYQFIGTTDIRDISTITYMSSSAPDRMVKVGEVRRVRG